MRSDNQRPLGFTLLTDLGLALLLSSVIVFVLDFVHWFKPSYWSAIKLSDVFRYCGISEPYFIVWSGVQKFWWYPRALPLSILLLLIWFLFTTLVGILFGSGTQNRGRGSGSGPGSRRRR